MKIKLLILILTSVTLLKAQCHQSLGNYIPNETVELKKIK